MTQVTEPDPFQIALARLAGLDPEQVVAGTLDVRLDRGSGGTQAHVSAEVLMPVDPDEVVRLAMEHNRIRPVA